jgi:hypothetical protein
VLTSKLRLEGGFDFASIAKVRVGCLVRRRVL